MQYKKYKNQAGMNFTPPPPSQNSHSKLFDYMASNTDVVKKTIL